MKNLLIKSIAVLSIFSLLPFSPAYAVNIPASDSAGAEQARLRQIEEHRKQDKAVLKKKEKPIQEEKEKAPSAYTGPKFRMNDIKITGNEKISTEEIQPIVGKLMNRDVNIQEIEDVVTEIKRLYRSRGYIATYVYVPPQKVKQGVIELRIVEGKLGEVEITGNKWFSSKVIGDRIKLEPGVVVEYQKLGAPIARLNENRDIKAKVVLKPGKAEGTTDVDVQVKDHFPVHLSTDVSNLGTANTGKNRWGATLTDTNVTGHMDQAAMNYQLGSNSWAAGADYNIPVNSYDTRVGFSYQHSAVHLGGDLKDLNIKGRADTYSPYINHPININDQWKLTLNTGFDFKEVQNNVLGTKAGKDSLRILNLGTALEENDRLGRTYLQDSFHIGFSRFLGASEKSEAGATRPGTGGQFTIYRQALVRYFGLPMGLGLVLRTALQLTNDTLPPSEQFRLGGAYSVRGYKEGEYTSDYGGTGSSEVFVPSLFFPASWKLPYSSENLQQQIKGTLFFDMGVGDNRSTLAGERSNRTLAGFGGGVRIHLFDKVYARLEWGRPVAPAPSNGNVFYYGISAEIF